MSLYRPKGSKVWWYEFQFANQRVRESTKTRSKTLAVEAERNRHRELERAFNGVKKRSSAKLFGGAAEEWLALKALNLAASSVRIEKANLKHILPSFSRRLVTDIEAGDIAKYQQARLVEGAASKTVNLEVGTIRSILRRNKVWAEIQRACVIAGLSRKPFPFFVSRSRHCPQYRHAVQRNPSAAMEANKSGR